MGEPKFSGWNELDDDDRTENHYVGPCERCGGDVYEDEANDIDGYLYCDQCAWWLTEAAKL